MARIWEPNEELDEEEELVVTEHRDGEEELASADDETSMETTVSEPTDVLEEFGEDVASSAAERGHDVPEEE